MRPDRTPARSRTALFRPISSLAWFLSCIGCGGAEPAGVDAGAEDATVYADSLEVPDAEVGPDAASDASVEPGPVTITVATGGAFAEGTPILFQDSDDNVIASLTADSAGTATATMAPGGSVSVVIARPGYVSILSVLGVEPGDHIYYGRPDPVFTEIEMRLPASSHDDAKYTVYSRCGAAYPLPTEPIAAFRRLSGCSAADVFVGARKNGNPYDDYGAFAVENLDLSGSSIDLTAQTYAAPSPIAITLTNTPAEITSAETSLAATTETAGVWLQAGVGDSYARFQGMALTPSATDTAAIPTIGGTAIKAHTMVMWHNVEGRTSWIDVHERVAIASTYGLDLSTVTIPTMIRPPSVDESGIVSWSESAGGTADWVRGSFRTQR